VTRCGHAITANIAEIIKAYNNIFSYLMALLYIPRSIYFVYGFFLHLFV
jgi:hypothetical protein